MKYVETNRWGTLCDIKNFSNSHRYVSDKQIAGTVAGISDSLCDSNRKNFHVIEEP